MADNKTKNKTGPTNASVAAFVRDIPDASKRAEAREVIAMMGRATGDKPVLWGPSIIGFGNFRYRTAAGRSGDMPVVAYSPRKSAHVFYIMPGFAAYEAMLAKLGPHKSGKACLYVKRLTDVDRGTLQKLIVASVSHMRKKADAAKPRKRRPRQTGGSTG